MDNQDSRRARELLLTIVFGSIGIVGLLIVFTVLTGGFLLYILAVVFGLFVFGALQYLVWNGFSRLYFGRSLSQYIADEREELEAREPLETESYEPDDPRRPRHG
jgi:hypothetical protein